MIDPILAKLFGTANERAIKRMQPVVQAINALEPSLQKLSDAELRQQTVEFRSPRERDPPTTCSRSLRHCAEAGAAFSACAITTCS